MVSDIRIVEKEGREPLLDPVERVSEFLFGLFMALTFVGAVSVATDGKAEIRTMFIAALGCNLAWGLVDGVMYVVQSVVARGRAYTLARSVRAAKAEAGRKLIEGTLSPTMAGLVSSAEIEAFRARLVALPSLPAPPTLHRDDLLGGLGIFLMCVIATFPVVLPFVFFADVGTAKTVSRGVALAMLFLGGHILGRYAGYGSWKAGFLLMALGTALVVTIMALGG
jgi:VIT1/CCC1 family predicted Fe2+/Mn2+ transporter